MSKPYIVCHMMMSIDGRIDCGMTVRLAGNHEYYETLAALNAPTRVSGRVTAQLEMASGKFHGTGKPLGHEAFSKKTDAEGYNVIPDTRGTLSWSDDSGSAKPLVILTCEQVSEDYLAFLDSRNISWIATGRDRIDLARASEILNEEFSVERMAVVGGGTINGGFLDARLLDEVSILIGPGIDGRKGMSATFDGLPMNHRPVALKLESVTPYDDGAVWLRYSL
ncbi:dihydrofolate reductase family protein [Bifidobacterium dentium]|uniref:dihydrofolate reductase family protein n=1 Tax=Bifidobacterium dentium TaxID=1689 RepID=UPI0007975F6B|nr:dihydrofolate reductase family protein [Bifidobacterium dentium]KXS23386.1 MAG: deaminase [Bifidobacterium dentium]MCK6131309.1 dihydrofolate reductase family protein [Bifidobacterium dentium]QTL77202.1 dihydrofolate reductase family protein [Bifidobacterium dentium]HBJ52018.1 deaminase [Bifidobacterium dentium]